MVSYDTQDGGGSSSWRATLMPGFHLGEAGEIQGQDMGGSILGSLFVYAF